MTKKKQRRERIRQFLLSFFPNSTKYETKEINGFILTHYFDNNYRKWFVAIYTKESFQKSQDFLLKPR